MSIDIIAPSIVRPVSRPVVWLPPPGLFIDFTNGQFGPNGGASFTRASTATSLLYTATSGAYSAAAVNVPRLSSLGFLVEGIRTNYLGMSDTPATQTTSSLATGTYTLWVIGSGSAAVTAGTATISGGAAASQGTPNTFTVSVAGTVTVTVTGALSRFQLENGAFPSSYIPNAGAAGTSVTRSAETCSLVISKFPYNQPSGTVGVSFIPGPGVAVSTGMGTLFSLEKVDGSANNLVTVDGDPQVPNHCGFTFTSGGTFYLNNSGSVAPALVEGQPHKAIITWDTTNVSYVDTGGVVQSLAATAPQAATQLYVGSRGGNQAIFGYVAQIYYWPYKLNAAQLKGFAL